jgi:hypothetical protein
LYRSGGLGEIPHCVRVRTAILGRVVLRTVGCYILEMKGTILLLEKTIEELSSVHIPLARISFPILIYHGVVVDKGKHSGHSPSPSGELYTKTNNRTVGALFIAWTINTMLLLSASIG